MSQKKRETLLNKQYTRREFIISCIFFFENILFFNIMFSNIFYKKLYKSENILDEPKEYKYTVENNISARSFNKYINNLLSSIYSYHKKYPDKKYSLSKEGTSLYEIESYLLQSKYFPKKGNDISIICYGVLLLKIENTNEEKNQSSYLLITTEDKKILKNLLSKKNKKYKKCLFNTKIYFLSTDDSSIINEVSKLIKEKNNDPNLSKIDFKNILNQIASITCKDLSLFTIIHAASFITVSTFCYEVVLQIFTKILPKIICISPHAELFIFIVFVAIVFAIKLYYYIEDKTQIPNDLKEALDTLTNILKRVPQKDKSILLLEKKYTHENVDHIIHFEIVDKIFKKGCLWT